MKAHFLLKQNIKRLLRARDQTAHDLALWCRRSDAWISKILNDNPESPSDKARGLPIKYLDRIGDFFGLEAYQLFQPGISPLTERRTGAERRQLADRRVSGRRADLPATPVRQIALTPEDEAILAELHALSYEQYQQVRGWVAVARYGRNSGQDRGATVAPPSEDVGKSPPTPRRRRSATSAPPENGMAGTLSDRRRPRKRRDTGTR